MRLEGSSALEASHERLGGGGLAGADRPRVVSHAALCLSFPYGALYSGDDRICGQL